MMVFNDKGFTCPCGAVNSLRNIDGIRCSECKRSIRIPVGTMEVKLKWFGAIGDDHSESAKAANSVALAASLVALMELRDAFSNRHFVSQ